MVAPLSICEAAAVSTVETVAMTVTGSYETPAMEGEEVGFSPPRSREAFWPLFCLRAGTRHRELSSVPSSCAQWLAKVTDNVLEMRVEWNDPH